MKESLGRRRISGSDTGCYFPVTENICLVEKRGAINKSRQYPFTRTERFCAVGDGSGMWLLWTH